MIKFFNHDFQIKNNFFIQISLLLIKNLNLNIIDIIKKVADLKNI